MKLGNEVAHHKGKEKNGCLGQYVTNVVGTMISDIVGSSTVAKETRTFGG